MSQPERARHQAFTLLELILVITVLGIMAGLIIPSLGNSLRGRQLKDYASLLSTLLHYARSVAVERSVVTKITFAEDSNEVRLAVESDPLNASGSFEDEAFPVYLDKNFASDVRIADIVKDALEGSQAEDEITFQPDGSTSDTFIYLTDGEERFYTVGVAGLTGQVMVWEGKAEHFYGEVRTQ